MNSREINDLIQKSILGGSKVPHSTSYPVIHKEGGKYMLAVFTVFFTSEDIKDGKVSRPSMWAVADIKTGKIIEERQTKDAEFSGASYDVKYDIRSNDNYDTSNEYYDKAFAILDSCREKIISTGECDNAAYRSYLDKIVANIPKDYQRFYFDLSI